MKQSRIVGTHPSPGTTLLTHTTNILASAEKMFPTPPSHEHPMQSPCGQMEHTTDLNSDINALNQNGIKMEPGYNGYSPAYLPDDNKVRVVFVNEMKFIYKELRFKIQKHDEHFVNLRC